MDKSKRKYYNKRRKRMFGADSDEEDEKKRREEGFVELRPQVVDFPRLHKREEELYFHDTFAYPWEKDKHYKMVYKLEKKYFPEHSLDKAFLEPGSESNHPNSSETLRKKKKDDDGDKGVVFFEGEKIESGIVVNEKKVEEFFKCLKKVPNESIVGVGNGEPYLLSRSSELPARWDSPNGTVVLINKPKGRDCELVWFHSV